MKIHYFVLLFIVSCSPSTSEKKNAKQDSSIKNSKTEKLNFTRNDIENIIINIDGEDSTIYPKKELDLILKCNPELNNDFIDRPDIVYSKRACNSSVKTYAQFSSEVGQDEYFVLYAYFLKKKTGDKKYIIQRNRLIKMYRVINKIFGILDYGGTYYGHQYKRIIGHVEYSIYSQIDNDDYYLKKYDFNKQKNHFIKLLSQYIEDEVAVDNSLFEKDKKNRKKELFGNVKELQSLITNFSDLKCAQEFLFSNY